MVYALSWQNPDLSIVDNYTTPAPVFPTEIVGRLSEFCEDMACSTGSPIDYICASLLTTAAALIGNTRRADNCGHNVPACIWTVLVGDPSTRKSPAMKPFREYLSDAEVELEDRRGRDVQLVLEDVTARATKEAVGHNPERMIVVADELRLFMRATTGADEGFWNRAYDGGPFSLIRKGERLRVRNLNISILAAGQPDIVKGLSNRKDNSGFAARFLYVYPERSIPVTTPQAQSPRVRGEEHLPGHEPSGHAHRASEREQRQGRVRGA